MIIFRTLLLVPIVFTSLFLQGQSNVIHFDTPVKMDNSINSPAEESSPIMSADAQVMFFARTLSTENVGGLYGGQDVWYSPKFGDLFENAENLKKVNNRGNNFIVGVARNGSRLYFLNEVTKKRKYEAGLSRSDYNAKTKVWSSPEPVSIEEFEVFGEFYGSYVDKDEKFALWSLPKKKNHDDSDLYISFSSDEGLNWSKPLYLGDVVNSDDDEISPFYDVKNEYLFFSKNNSGDPADYDIYYTKRLDDSWTSWSEPINAQELNSPKFDAYLHIDSFGSVYFSSNRSDTLSNIYESRFFEVDSLYDMLVQFLDTNRIEIPKVQVLPPPKELIAGSRFLSNMADNSLGKNIPVKLFNNLRLAYFDFDKSVIKFIHTSILDEIADSLKHDPDLNLVLIGYTDSIGPVSYNLKLSERRGKAAMEYLVGKGVSRARLEVLGKGEEDPIATNSTDIGRAMNRRVDIFFRKTQKLASVDSSGFGTNDF